MSPVVTLEFGGRATGEPHQVFHIACDIAAHLADVSFPVASPLVMSVARTFWEKATALRTCSARKAASAANAMHCTGMTWPRLLEAPISQP